MSAGDADGNGQVEFADFVILSNTFGQMSGVATVPEPWVAAPPSRKFVGLHSF